MKSYLISLGETAERALPTVLTALSAGITKPVPSLFLLRVPFTSATGVNDALLRDFRTCSRLFSGCPDLPCFQTEFTGETCTLSLPDRSALLSGGGSDLLLTALRGENQPLSYPTDREAVEWAVSGLLNAEDERTAPFRTLRDQIRQDLENGEEPRVLILADPCSGYAAGAAAALVRFLRASFPADTMPGADLSETDASGSAPDTDHSDAAHPAVEAHKINHSVEAHKADAAHPAVETHTITPAPFLGLLLMPEPSGAGSRDQIGQAAEALQAYSDRNLIRAADDRPTAGADAAWLISLPASLGTTPEARRVARFAAARVMAEVYAGRNMPSAGMHTREIQGTLSLSVLGAEAPAAAGVLRAAVWCLADLFPSLHQYFDHPTLLRSLAPASRNGLFRRLFRQGDGAAPEEFPVIERVLKVMLLELMSLIRELPEPLREAEKNALLWQDAVRACGRAVTVASEYDVSRAEARESGVDKVAPVHRVSMADTDEEQLLRKLDHLSEDVAAAIADRSDIFAKMGGFRARQALEDCLNRCLDAEKAARDKLAAMPAETPDERLSLGLQARRVRLLEAAVARCRRDLKDMEEPGHVDAPAAAPLAATPWSGEILSPQLAESCFALLTGENAAKDEAARNLRDHLDALLFGQPLSDVKVLLKNLLAACRDPGAEMPLRTLLAGIFSVCLSETRGLRFSPPSALPSVSLLPDMTGGDRFFTVSAAAKRIIAPPRPDRTAFLRGLLALLILRQYRRRGMGEAALETDPVEPDDSVLSRVWLSSRGAERAWILSLSRREGEETRKLPFAVILPGQAPEPAFLTAAHGALIPSFCVWYRPEERIFADPCPYLSEGDRKILTELFTALRAELKDSRSRAFTSFLSEFHRDLMQARPPEQEDPRFAIRLKAACALTRLPAWKKDLSRIYSFFERFLTEDPVCACLSGREHFPAAACVVPDDILYTFRGTPFARESAQRLLESPCLPGESALLSSLNAECEILSHSSDDYHEALLAGLTELLSRYPDALPRFREEAEKLAEKAKEPVGEQVTELTWPWDTVSSSVLTILTECLGKDLGAAALHPFSDALVIFPARGGEVIGDALLSRMCVLPAENTPTNDKTDENGDPIIEKPLTAGAPGTSGEENPESAPAPEVRVPDDAVLPPLSSSFAAALCALSQGRTLIQEGFLRFSREGGKICSVLTLEGAFTLKLRRLWSPEEVLSLYTHDMPTLALWPALPLPRNLWHAYYVYAHVTEGFRVALCLEDGEEQDLEGAAPRCAGAFPCFPQCFAFYREDTCLGALPNLLPAPELPSSGDWTVSLDFGSAASSVVFSAGDSRWPLQGAGLVRCLLRCPSASEELLWREFMPAVPLAPILPGALRIFRNTPFAGGEPGQGSPVPFRDGSIFLSASLNDVLQVPPEALYTDLKWNEEKGRASGLYLHQLMLLCALQARCGGASTLCWRAAIPDEMAAGGRERLANMLTGLAIQVSRETALPLPQSAPPVAYASESSALGAYFRLCSPEETRGGFLLLDLGADTADISLFLRGRDHAVRTCQLPLGIHYMLLPSLLKKPSLLAEDFSFVPDPALQRDIAALRALLESARTSAPALRQSRYALDAFIADHEALLHQALAQRMAGNAPGRTGALLLLHFSWLMMLTGLVLLQVAGDPGRNDFLPEHMCLCLSGRGAGLMEALSQRTKTSLWKILTMFRNPRVSSLSLLFSAEKKLEIPVGLSCAGDLHPGVPQASPVPVSISIRPEELIPEFMNRFRREFPAEAELLFPGLYSRDPWHPFTEPGLQAIYGAISSAFASLEGKDGAGPRPYTALAACVGILLEMSAEIPKPAPPPQPYPQQFMQQSVPEMVNTGRMQQMPPEMPAQMSPEMFSQLQQQMRQAPPPMEGRKDPQ